MIRTISLKKIKQELLKHPKKTLILQFITTFTILSLPLHLLMNTQTSLYAIEKTISWTTQQLLQKINKINTTEITGIEPNGLKMPIIIMEPFPTGVGISRACTGYRSIIALTALIISTPLIPLRKKIKPIIIGTITLFTINIIRIYTTLLITNKLGLNWFEITHTTLWREGLITIIIITWYYWLTKINYKKTINQYLKKSENPQ